MKKVLLVLSLVFAVLTFAGAGYVLATDGQASPGYGVVPMLCCLVCLQGHIALKRRDN